VNEDDVEILEKTTAFQGYFRIDRYHLRIRQFDGGWSTPFHREIFERGHAVGLVLYDPLRDEVGLIEQFRPGALAAGWSPWMIELPAGVIDHGQTPEQVAIREAKEETGLDIADPILARHYLATPGGSSESMRIYAARIDSTRLSGIHGLKEEAEDIRVFPVPADQAFHWIESGRICNAMTIVGLEWLRAHRDSLRRRWAAETV